MSSAAVDVAPAAPFSPADVSVDPFVYDASKHEPAIQVIKMIIIGLILLPIRGTFLLLSFFFFWLTAFIGSLGMKDVRSVQFPHSKPITRLLLRIFARIILWSLGYWWITVDGEFNDKARVVVSNHCSFIDPFYFTYALLPMAVAKAELFRVPMLGSIAKVVQAIPVSRAASESRHDVSHEIKRRTQWGIQKPTSPSTVDGKHEEERGAWPPLLIFPEATCTNTRSIIQFKFGAFAPRVAVQPVALDFRQAHLDVSWPGDAPVGMTILRMMCQLYNTLHVTYLPLAEPLGQDETVPDFAGRVQRSIADALRVPVTMHTFTPPVRPASSGKGGRAKPADAAPAAPPAAAPALVMGESAPVATADGNKAPYGAAAATGPSVVEDVRSDEEEESVPDLVRSCSLVP